MSKPTDPQQLIEAHFLGSLSNGESAELEALLLADPSLRDDFRQAAALDTALRDVHGLLEREILVKNPGGGRSTSYRIADSDS